MIHCRSHVSSRGCTKSEPVLHTYIMRKSFARFVAANLVCLLSGVAFTPPTLQLDDPGPVIVGNAAALGQLVDSEMNHTARGKQLACAVIDILREMNR